VPNVREFKLMVLREGVELGHMELKQTRDPNKPSKYTSEAFPPKFNSRRRIWKTKLGQGTYKSQK
jgi:hypothetical protein